MTFGLPEQTLDQIKACISECPDIIWVKIYGSRAMETYETGSDIDLAFSGPTDYTLRLKGSFDELPTPYMFDVTYYDGLQNKSLVEHIDCVGKILYRK